MLPSFRFVQLQLQARLHFWAGISLGTCTRWAQSSGHITLVCCGGWKGGGVSVACYSAACGFTQLMRRVHSLPPVDGGDGPDKSMEQGFVKFPRTGHLYNLGRATRDDLVMEKEELHALLSTDDPNVRVVVQEKIDGANLGITMDAQTLAFLVQNRSHYVNSKSHAQFRQLDLWLQNHESDLWSVLTGNETLPPGQLVLFGEWVFAKHSIHYTKLPDYFVAFDLYDTLQERFYSSSRLRDMLNMTSLHAIPELQVGGVLSKKAFEQLVCTQSVYYDGMVEGVYVRWETDMWTVGRAKVVRPNFVCGNEHWKKGQVTVNQLAKNRGSEVE